MPNYMKLEQDILPAKEQSLATASRQPAIAALDAPGLIRLIDDLTKALATAGEPGKDGKVTRADLLATALRRAMNERRRRGLTAEGKPRGGTGTKPTTAKPASASRTSPAKAKTVTRRETRKPAGRKTSETRKPDQRTGSRRIAKLPAKPAPLKPAIHPEPAAAVVAASPIAAPRTEAVSSGSAALPADTAKAAKKAAKKAALKVAKQAEKELKKAARKAEKEAERAARKAAKKAARKAAIKAADAKTKKSGKKE